MDMKLEAVVLSVSDVDRAKRFYQTLGWRLDADFAFDSGVRIVQLTPPGSGCSIQFGSNITSAAPGSAQDLYLIVSDIEAARDQLVANGVASAGPRLITRPIALLPPSATRTATAGCCRRSRRGCPDDDETAIARRPTGIVRADGLTQILATAHGRRAIQTEGDDHDAGNHD